MRVLAVLTVNVTNVLVLAVILAITILVIVHLVRVYKKSPCGDCASAKTCQAFSKKNLIKAYKKQCKLEKN